MLVAISGAQSSGKTTTLQTLQAKGYNCVSRKTSRSILTDWDVTLQQVNADPILTIKFQEEIIKRKSNDEREARGSDDLWFTERTYSDLFTYALVSLGKDNQYSDWLDKYYNDCMRYQQTYDLVYYLKAGHFAPAHDGVRGSGIHYSRLVDLVMVDFTKQMTSGSVLTMIETPSLDVRVSTIVVQTTGLMKRIANTETRNDGK